jgi:hypothetical protein
VRVSLEPKTIREMIQHEDALRDQRLRWQFTLDGFLFATVGLVWNDKHSTGLIYALAAAGVLIGLSGLGAMGISRQAISNLRKEAGEGNERVMGIQPGEISRWQSLLYPWWVMPIAMIVIWPVIALLHAKNF